MHYLSFEPVVLLAVGVSASICNLLWTAVSIAKTDLIFPMPALCDMTALPPAGSAQASQKPLSAVLLGHKLAKVFLPKADSLVLERRDHVGSGDLTQRLKEPAARRQLNARRLGRMHKWLPQAEHAYQSKLS